MKLSMQQMRSRHCSRLKNQKLTNQANQIVEEEVEETTEDVEVEETTEDVEVVATEDVVAVHTVVETFPFHIKHRLSEIEFYSIRKLFSIFHFLEWVIFSIHFIRS